MLYYLARYGIVHVTQSIDFYDDKKNKRQAYVQVTQAVDQDDNALTDHHRAHTTIVVAHHMIGWADKMVQVGIVKLNMEKRLSASAFEQGIKG